MCFFICFSTNIPQQKLRVQEKWFQFSDIIEVCVTVNIKIRRKSEIWEVQCVYLLKKIETEKNDLKVGQKK